MSKQSRRTRKSQPATRKQPTQPPPPNPRQDEASVSSEPLATDDGESTSPRAAKRRDDRRQQREQQEQRKKWFRIGGATLVGVLVLGVLWGAYRSWMGPDVSAEVVSYFGKDTAVAVHPEDDTFILYEQVPPVGGPHNAIWQTCGFYPDYIFNWHGVHALEHGAVWLTYDPSLPQEEIDTLAAKAGQGYVLVSPYPGLDAPVVGSVWGKQMTFTGVDDERIDAFIKQYRLNDNNTPEPGARCTGGVTWTTDQVPQQNAYKRADPEGDVIGGLTSIDATATAQAQETAATGDAPESTPVASTSRDAAAGS